ncbi:MAG: hypothetical protein DRQ37_08585 [Gammaproteobacteria bacterium]|nr:MAG: hypothetical protein DRQ37_08585 [Gammaproteobacteria bacterium]
MAIRIKSRWPERKAGQEAARRMDEHASALGFITWRVSLETAKSLHREGFSYDSDRERVGVITEFLAFLTHCVDRLTHGRLGDDERDELVNCLGHHLADQIQDNLTDIVGPGNYRSPFIQLLNDTLEEYSGLSFADGEPGFDMLRYLGGRILSIMGEDQTNRWVLDQVMSISAPEAFDQVQKALQDLLRTGTDDPQSVGD